MLWGEVSAYALRNPVGRGGGVRHVFLRAAAGNTYKRARRGAVGHARLNMLQGLKRPVNERGLKSNPQGHALSSPKFSRPAAECLPTTRPH